MLPSSSHRKDSFAAASNSDKSVSDDNDDDEFDFNSDFEEEKCDDSEYMDVAVGQLPSFDSSTFTIEVPPSYGSTLCIPLWTVSVHGLKIDSLRRGDKYWMEKFPPEFGQALVQLRQDLDPFEMDEPVAIFRPNLCRQAASVIFGYMSYLVRKLVIYFENEWERYKLELRALRLRADGGNVEGYLSGASPIHEDIEVPETPEMIPSKQTLDMLVDFNSRIARPHQMQVTLVRVQHAAAGSQVIGFYLKLQSIQVFGSPKNYGSRISSLINSSSVLSMLVDNENKEHSANTKQLQPSTGQEPVEPTPIVQLNQQQQQQQHQHVEQPLLIYVHQGRSNLELSSSTALGFWI